MYNNIKLIIKGFIIGLGKIIPGVSGAVLAMMLNVYEPALIAIANIKTNFYKLATQLNLLKKQVFEWLLNILCIKIDKNNM